MATMTQISSYVQLAAKTASYVTSGCREWTEFLKTAARLYRYSFTDQLLIHAQAPDASACADYDTWSRKMNWFVKRGSRGIALVDVKDGRPKLRYVFDIKDTGRRRDSYNLCLWKYKAEEHRKTVTDALEKHYDVYGRDGFFVQVAYIASQTAKGFWKKYRQEISHEAEGSLLGEQDAHGLRVKFCEMAAYSITYIILSRCGLPPEDHFAKDAFCGITDFNTPRIIKTLGCVVSQSAGEMLHVIAAAVMAYEREKKAAQSTGNPDRYAGIHKQPSAFVISAGGDTAMPDREVYVKYKSVVKDFLMKDTAYLNACRNSDRENAYMEGMEAVRRAALSVSDLRFMKLFYDMAELHARLQQEVLDETYRELSSRPGTVQDTKETSPAEPERAASIQETVTPDQEETAVQNPETVTPDRNPEEPAAKNTESAAVDQEETAVQSPETVTPDQEETTVQIPESAADQDQEEKTGAGPEPEEEEKPVTVLDESEVEELPPVLDESEVEELPPVRAASDFRITDDRLGVGSAKDKFSRNMRAIATLKQTESEKRPATPEEQEILSQYTGWGGIPQAFDRDRADWSEEYRKLQTALTPEEYGSARASVLNAHYTCPAVIQAVYRAVSRMGFKSGNILEPSCGIGNFFGLLPESMEKSKLYGVELDSITGRIAKLLYPEADIRVCGYEKADFQKNFFDLAVGNVSFGQYRVNDPAYDRLGFSIHNYFFAKTLDLVRPGGILAFVTSRYTMDAQNTSVRAYLSERADLLGAVRLPNSAFKANAGTEVVSDIIFLQKRDTPAVGEPAWVRTAQNTDGFAINRYFIDHPEMVLGIPSSRSTQYGKQDYTVLPLPDADLAAQLDGAVSHIHGKYQEAAPAETDKRETAVTIPADPRVKNYSFTVAGNNVYYRENSIMTMQSLGQMAKSRITGMIKLRDCVHALIALQMDENVPDSGITEKQAELNRLYDAFTRKYELINSKANRLAFDKDSSYHLLCSLEILDDDGKLERKADMFTKRTIKPHKAVTHVDTASEALTVSIGERAKVDLPFMAQLTGKTEDELVRELQGVIFKDPAGGIWQTADEYLSGNVRRKLRLAKKTAEQDPAYQVNARALEAAQPKDLDASEIEVRIGATWIDKSYIQQFMNETLNTPYSLRGKITVNYSKVTAEWFITNKTSIPYRDVAAYTTYGTARANAYKILEDSLNLRDVRIYDTVTDAAGKEKRVLNAKETTLAAQKQSALREAFRDWIFRDPERRQALVKLYNELMNSTRPREYDGSHITFAGMNPEIRLQPHQTNAIARVLYGGNTLLAHEVGAGKTFEIVAACMESKRLGLCHKSAIVVPNHLTEQTAAEFLRLYPAANILVTTKKDFETANRKKFCARIATSDIDAVIIGHSQFERIPVSYERRERHLQEEIREITDGIAEVKASNGERFTVKQLERTKKILEARLQKLQADHRKDDVVTFEQLGVDMMFVDESDMYKNRVKRCRIRQD